jgi:mannosyltransferase OCH1-like enzyme/glycosyltransferase involved in cell wall biosynthesis
MIPKIIHQTWKSRQLPYHLAALQATWQEHHPDWEYRLWTDADNRDFLATHYAWFLPTYDGYAHFISRVDAIRYFWLDFYGGLYVDLDFECLSPIDWLLAAKSIVLSLEPQAHIQENYRAQALNLTKIISPALIASAAKHPFWEHVWQQLSLAKDLTDPLAATGPFLLTHAYETYPMCAEIEPIAADRLHPLTLKDLESGCLFDLAVRSQISQQATAIHHWQGSWWKQDRSSLDEAKIGGCSVSILEKGNEIVAAKYNHLSYQTISIDPISLPKVSCLMVVKNQACLAKRAIFCFLQQTYLQKELIIIDDGEGSELAAFIRQFPHPQITYYRLSCESLTLGELRNLAIEKATGTYLAQWDDDDLSDPQRLELQMAIVRAFRVDGCFLDSIYTWWPYKQKLAQSLRRVWEGTLIYRKEILLQYPSLSQGEDTDVVQFIFNTYRIAAIDLPELYIYNIHQNNNRNTEHFDEHWQQVQLKFEAENYLRILEKFATRMPIHSYLQSLVTPTSIDEKNTSSDIGINIAGLTTEGFGINEGLKCCLTALKAGNIDCVFHRAGVTTTTNIDNPYPINLIHANPDMLLDPQQQILASLGDRYLAEKYNIGYWVWENRQDLPSQWLTLFNLFDEIWTPSSYSQQAIAPISPVPVVTIPHAISLPEMPTYSRQELGWQNDKFIFLFIYDSLSLAVRKNPQAVITAFTQAFNRHDDRVSLVIKSKGLSTAKLDELQHLTANRDGIEIINDNFDRDRINSMIYHCNCYISLHRSEGFGLTLAEAMFYGKPTIATGYSGNLEFMNCFNSLLVDYQPYQLDRDVVYFKKGTIWAEPDLNVASDYMRQLVDKPDLAARIGARAKQDIRSQFSPQSIGLKIRRRLQTIVAEL